MIIFYCVFSIWPGWFRIYLTGIWVRYFCRRSCRSHLTYILCLSVCLYPINVKTVESIGPKFFVGPNVTPGNGYGCSNFRITRLLLFQLLIVALFVSIFTLYSIKKIKFADFIIFFGAFSTFYKNKKLLNTKFSNFDHS